MDPETEKTPETAFLNRSPRERLGTLPNPSDPVTGRLDGDSSLRSKTSTRIFYEAQVEVIKKQLGSLENVREKLGLSQRKMAQLLLVDPSAWTRWNRSGEEAPPHIWRALQWYFAMSEKIPGLTPQYFIGKDPQILHEKTLGILSLERTKREQLESELVILQRSQLEIQERLLKNVHFHRVMSYFFAILSLALAFYAVTRP